MSKDSEKLRLFKNAYNLYKYADLLETLGKLEESKQLRVHISEIMKNYFERAFTPDDNLIKLVIEEIKEDLDSEYLEALEELLLFIPVSYLKNYLSEIRFKKL